MKYILILTFISASLFSQESILKTRIDVAQRLIDYMDEENLFDDRFYWYVRGQLYAYQDCSALVDRHCAFLVKVECTTSDNQD